MARVTLNDTASPATDTLDILAAAREQVLEQGRGLDERQLLEVLELPDARIEELLALAHEVRERWCGPEVEVEGIVSVKTGGCPEDCHFCSQSGQFTSPVRSAWLDIPSLVEAAKLSCFINSQIHRSRSTRKTGASAGTSRRWKRCSKRSRAFFAASSP